MTLSDLKGKFVFGALRSGSDVYLVCGFDKVYRLSGVTAVVNAKVLRRTPIADVEGATLFTVRGACLIQGATSVEEHTGGPPSDVQPLEDF